LRDVLVCVKYAILLVIGVASYGAMGHVLDYTD